MRVILIEPATKTIAERDQETDLKSLQSAVGGPIEYACDFRNGDSLIVNENGFFEMNAALRGMMPAEKAFLFSLDGIRYAGTGIIVGVEDSSGNHNPAKSTLEDIQNRVMFFEPAALACDESVAH